MGATSPPQPSSTDPERLRQQRVRLRVLLAEIRREREHRERLLRDCPTVRIFRATSGEASLSGWRNA